MIYHFYRMMQSSRRTVHEIAHGAKPAFQKVRIYDNLAECQIIFLYHIRKNLFECFSLFWIWFQGQFTRIAPSWQTFFRMARQSKQQNRADWSESARLFLMVRKMWIGFGNAPRLNVWWQSQDVFKIDVIIAKWWNTDQVKSRKTMHSDWHFCLFLL